MMARPGRQLPIARAPKLPAQRLLADRDCECVPNPLRQVDEAPAHHTVRGRDRPVLDDAHEGKALLGTEQRPRPTRLAIDQAIGAPGVEPHDPVADDLKADAADPCSFAAGPAVIDRGQCQQPPDLPGVLADARQPQQNGATKIRA